MASSQWKRRDASPRFIQPLNRRRHHTRTRPRPRRCARPTPAGGFGCGAQRFHTCRTGRGRENGGWRQGWADRSMHLRQRRRAGERDFVRAASAAACAARLLHRDKRLLLDRDWHRRVALPRAVGVHPGLGKVPAGRAVGQPACVRIVHVQGQLVAVHRAQRRRELPDLAAVRFLKRSQPADVVWIRVYNQFRWTHCAAAIQNHNPCQRNQRQRPDRSAQPVPLLPTEASQSACESACQGLDSPQTGRCWGCASV